MPKVYTVYSIFGYGEMIKDRFRMAAYEQALRAVIRPGCVVADIGAGTGVMSFLACRLGAARIYAIEPADAIEVARALAVANGFADKIVFIQDFSTRVTLPQPADVVVADLRGVLPWFGHNIPAVIDARTRLLAPGGALVPQRDTLWLGVVRAPELYDRMTAAWADNGLGLNLEPAKRLALNNWGKGPANPEQLVTEPRPIAVLDYATTTDVNLDAETTCTVTRPATAHGFNAWFDTVLTGSIGFSNTPGQPPLLYGQAFFPWPEPVELTAGDRVTVRLRANLVGDDYVWNWDTTVCDGGGINLKGSFRQSTFWGVPLSPAALRRGAASSVPQLGPEGCIDRLILSLMDGQHTCADIARRVADCHADRFPRWEDALARVGELSKRYGR
jgi:protein arginine N-methyltransferase 1